MKRKEILPWGTMAVAAAMLLWLGMGVGQIQRDMRRQGAQQLETALRQAAVACYGAEGIYPPDVAYLQRHYGVRIDESRYVVHYQIFADNLMPEITVLEKSQ